MLSQRAEDRASVERDARGHSSLATSWPEEEIVRRYKSASDEETFDQRAEKWQAMEKRREERLRIRSASAMRQNAPHVRSLHGSLAIPDPERVHKGMNVPDGSQKVAFYGGASVTVPKIWGRSLTATMLREAGAELRGTRGKVEIVFPDEKAPMRGEPAVSKVVHQDAPDGFAPWEPSPGRTEERWGQTYLPLAAAAVGDTAVRSVKALHDGGRMFAVERDAAARGLENAARLYRTLPIVGTVAVPRREIRPRKVTPRAGASYSFATQVDPGRSVRATVGATDLEAARIKRAADRPVLCDARNAPIRNIVAF